MGEPAVIEGYVRKWEPGLDTSAFERFGNLGLWIATGQDLGLFTVRMPLGSGRVRVTIEAITEPEPTP